MRKVAKNVTKAEAEEVKKLVQKCVRLLRKKQYELNLPKNVVDIALSVLEIKSTNSGRCYGGEDDLIINLAYWQFGNSVHIEYKSFNEHPTIGKIKVTSREDHLMLIVSHEVAHHVQFRYGPRIKRYRETYNKPHGHCFRSLYAYLRRDLVNKEIKTKY